MRLTCVHGCDQGTVLAGPLIPPIAADEEPNYFNTHHNKYSFNVNGPFNLLTRYLPDSLIDHYV